MKNVIFKYVYTSSIKITSGMFSRHTSNKLVICPIMVSCGQWNTLPITLRSLNPPFCSSLATQLTENKTVIFYQHNTTVIMARMPVVSSCHVRKCSFKVKKLSLSTYLHKIFLYQLDRKRVLSLEMVSVARICSYK